MTVSKDRVIEGVAQATSRFIGNRRRKLEAMGHTTMAVNPFLNPLMMEMNGHDSLKELSTFVIGGHLSEGHATGFGKLVDERIVAEVFATTKLTAGFRRSHPPYDEPMFGVIDHLVPRSDGTQDLLPLKAGRWSIQLGQAVNMNAGFARLLEARDAGRVEFDRIVIGVLYGTEATLTDKFRIAQGIGPHDVTDIREHVDVRAGREFWSWLNDGVSETQDWVLDGILKAIEQCRESIGPAADALEAYQESYEQQITRHQQDDGSVDWHALLREVNG